MIRHIFNRFEIPKFLKRMEIIKLDQTDKKVFIIENGEYKEIPYSDFRICLEAIKRAEKEKTDEAKPDKRFFIAMDDTILEVTHEQYIDYYKDKRRQKYVGEEAEAVGVFFAEDLSDSSISGEEIFVDTAPDVCDTAVKQILIEKVRDALAMLPQDEREFIVRIFFENRTERQLAKEYCISQVAVNKRKAKILTKLKQIMNF